jgi:formylglycine-generating enzyme required for sulfatase activity
VVATACVLACACSSQSKKGPVQTRTWKDGQLYVWVEPGTFDMGCVEGDADCRPDEQPRRSVTLPRGFWMARTEVSTGVYQRFLTERQKIMPRWPPWTREGAMDDLPMVNVSWEEAAAYCEGNWARLPTEAEWEYAARAGHEGWKYVWGKDDPPLKGDRPLANIMDLSVPLSEGLNVFTEGFEGYRDGYGYVAPVGSFLPNAFGIHDLGGNVSEWCQERIARGASWASGRRQTRVSSRRETGGYGSIETGLRCVLDPD